MKLTEKNDLDDEVIALFKNYDTNGREGGREGESITAVIVFSF